MTNLLSIREAGSGLMTESITLTCPTCNEEVTGQEPLISHTPEPAAGDVGFCMACSSPFQYLEDGAIRVVTAEDLTEMRRSKRFSEMEIHARVDIARKAAADPDGPIDIVLPHSGHDDSDGPHEHHITAIPISFDEDGYPHIPENTITGRRDLSESLMDAIAKVRTDLVTVEVKKWVTPEVAHHVLSHYGNTEASMPSLTVSAMISLIRMANECDEEMLMSLNEVEYFHGYVLAVRLFAEDDTNTASSPNAKGMQVLRRIADLCTDEDLAASS